MTIFNRFFVTIFTLGIFSAAVQAAIDWTGSGRIYHQRWSFGEDGSDNYVNRNREKLIFTSTVRLK